MTISYQFNVHTATLGGFARLLFRWSGSVYKLVFKETVIFGLLYATVSIIYRVALDEPQRRTFESVARHIGDNKNLIPLTFVLGFYVQFVVGRWWDQYNHYPWPDRILALVILYINGTDERSRLIRRTLARWTCLSTILLTRGVSVVAKKRFPTLQHLIDAGLMTKEEVDLYEDVNIPYAKYWVPMLWCTQLLTQARREKTFDDPTGVATKHIFEEIATFRTNQWKIWSFDWVSVPIVYTQVVTLATYVYFFGCLFSRQFLDPEQQYQSFYVDFYFPIFTFLQFFFYVGWLKVAESLINPWGEDDDDFEVNWFIDRHVQVAFLVVDEKFGQMPTLVKDMYWDTTEVKVPYTSASAELRRKSAAHIGSTINLEIPRGSQTFLKDSANGHFTDPCLSAFQRNSSWSGRRSSLQPRGRKISEHTNHSSDNFKNSHPLQEATYNYQRSMDNTCSVPIPEYPESSSIPSSFHSSPDHLVPDHLVPDHLVPDESVSFQCGDPGLTPLCDTHSGQFPFVRPPSNRRGPKYCTESEEEEELLRSTANEAAGTTGPDSDLKLQTSRSFAEDVTPNGRGKSPSTVNYSEHADMMNGHAR
ncbi:Bestrophin-1 [Hypsibius exemplaris]|uniref:Bestrophin homolog n=1 Tax=Hypsibius exemplaris TaxID=2072580 RepID=A0A1W0WA97_HYPEX|nr:Bestrophin-1 [Hypsibius exemplaris]